MTIAPEQDLHLYARSFQTAAKKLARALELDSGAFTRFDACPVDFMYHHALELHLKALVLGEGGNFLAAKPDTLSIYKTHSVSWLAQFACQIVTALKWEKAFTCEGIENLANIMAVIEELNAVDPGSYVFRLPVGAEGHDSTPGRANRTIRDFARRNGRTSGAFGFYRRCAGGDVGFQRGEGRVLCWGRHIFNTSSLAAPRAMCQCHRRMFEEFRDS